MVYLALAFFAIALTYSMAGLGGASAYIALLALFAVPHDILPPVVLLCNIIVVAGGSYHFARAGHLSWRFTIPFVVASVPAAYVAGSIHVDRTTFMAVLATALLLAGLRMIVTIDTSGVSVEDIKARGLWRRGLPIGVVLGSLSGLVGIGGGVFLVSILSVIKWGTSKQMAATTSFFILVNSIAGLAGQLSKHNSLAFLIDYIWLFLAVCLGGQLGSRLGSRKLSHRALRIATAILVLTASINLYRRVFGALFL